MLAKSYWSLGCLTSICILVAISFTSCCILDPLGFFFCCYHFFQTNSNQRLCTKKFDIVLYSQNVINDIKASSLKVELFWHNLSNIETIKKWSTMWLKDVVL